MEDEQKRDIESLIQAMFAFAMFVAFLFLLMVLYIDAPRRTDFDSYFFLSVLVIFHLPALVGSIRSYLFLRKKSSEPIRFRRPTFWSNVFSMMSFLPVVLVLFFTYDRIWTFETIGFSLWNSWLLDLFTCGFSIFVGVTTSIVYVTAILPFYRLVIGRGNHSTNPFDASVIRSMLPRGKKGSIS